VFVSSFNTPQLSDPFNKTQLSTSLFNTGLVFFLNTKKSKN